MLEGRLKKMDKDELIQTCLEKARKIDSIKVDLVVSENRIEELLQQNKYSNALEACRAVVTLGNKKPWFSDLKRHHEFETIYRGCQAVIEKEADGL